MDVADDVERSGEVPQIVVAPLAGDLGGLRLLHAPQDVHLAEPLALQVAQGSAQFALVALDDPAGQPGAVGARRVALRADLFGHVEDDGHRQHVVLAGQPHELLAALRLDARGVDHGEPAGREPLARDVVQDVEGVPAGALVVLVVTDQTAAEVGRDDLGGLEVACREGGLAGTGGSDEDHEGEVGHGESAPGTGIGFDADHAAFSSFRVASRTVSPCAVLSCTVSPWPVLACTVLAWPVLA